MTLSPPTDTKIATLTRIMCAVAGAALLAMMVLTVIDVAGRFLAGRPLTGANEMIRMALAVSVSCALPAVTLARGHISLELLKGRADHPLERLRALAVAIFSAGVFAVLAWFLWEAAMEAIEYKDVIGYLELPLAPMILVMVAMAAACSLILLLECSRALAGHGQSAEAGKETTP